MTKKKFPKAKIQSINQSTAKNIAGGYVLCFSNLSQVTYKIKPQIQDFKRVLNLICK